MDVHKTLYGTPNPMDFHGLALISSDFWMDFRVVSCVFIDFHRSQWIFTPTSSMDAKFFPDFARSAERSDAEKNKIKIGRAPRAGAAHRTSPFP